LIDLIAFDTAIRSLRMRVSVRRASVADLDAASDALADAFADYPWTRWTIDGDRHVERVRALQRLFMERIALPYGEVWVATDELRAVIGAAIWSVPGAVVPAEVLRDVDGARAELEGVRSEASAAAEAYVAGSRPSTPHYYLGAVGTRRDHQRRGVGRALLAPVIDRAAAAGFDIVLETSAPENLDFSARLGFVTAAESTVPGGGPPVWALRRDHRVDQDH
jgi:GNAT superfamily N-acetyltransferase